MALASQTARQSGSVRTFGRVRTGGKRGRGRSRGPKRLAGVALILIVGLAAMWMWRRSHAEPAAVNADTGLVAAAPAELSPPSSAAFDKQTTPNSLAKALPEPVGKGAASARSADLITMGQPLAPLPSSSLTSASADQARVDRALTEDRRSSDTAQTTQPQIVAGALQALLDDAASAANQNRPVASRALYNRALFDPRADDSVRDLIRSRISELNDLLIFSPIVVEGDPLAWKYTVRPSDMLSRIVRTQGANIEWRFIQRINRIANPAAIRVGQSIKLVKGPFHAVISKSKFRLDIYAGAVPEMAGSSGRTLAADNGEQPIYIRSFTVGLGEYSSTPLGRWRVNSSKSINPTWKNPRTGEFFAADAPDNPIGERWIGLDGVDTENELLRGYGLHGTIDPDSIGKERSMGCVRLLPADIDLLYEMLEPDKSTVLVVE